MSWFSERFKIAEVDGITFYTQNALNQYLHDKKVKEARKGLHNYKVYCGPLWELRDRAANLLQQNNIFDFECYQDEHYNYIVSYWADHPIIVYKN